MSRLAALVVLAPLLAGCVYTRPASLASPTDRAEVNARAERGHAVVTLAGERGRHVRALHVGPDTTTWVNKRTGESRSAPTSDVAAVTFRRDGAGALKGAAIGTSVGVLLGLLSEPSGSGFITFSRSQAAGLFGINGALFGALAGAIHSERHVYRVVPEDVAARVEEGASCGGLPLACAASARGPGR